MRADPIQPRRAADAGFTLLEILVVLVVLGLLLATLAQGTQFGLRAWQSQARMVSERGDLDAVDRSLRTMIERMNPGGYRGERPAFTGTTRVMTFRTELPMAAGALASRDADVTVAVDAAHRLQLRWRMYYRNPIGPPLAPGEALLLEGVDHIEIAYFQPAGAAGETAPAASGLGGTWLPTWVGPVLPKLIRIRIRFDDPKRPAWPDIVAAPRRDRQLP